MLTVQQIKGLTPQAKPYRITDGNSMVIEVSPSGARSFRLRYRIKAGDDTKARILTLGTFPDMSLLEARQMAAAARKLIAEGKDPSQQRRVAAAQAAAVTAATFDAVFQMVAAEKKKRRKDPEGRTHQTYLTTAEKYLLKPLHGIPLADITALQLKGIVSEVYDRIPGTGATLVSIINEVYILAAGLDIYKGGNPATYLFKVFPRPASVNQPSARECESLGQVLRDIDTLNYFPRVYLRLIALTFVRSIELRHAEWSEFDLEKAVWTVPASRMKMKREHKVPLPLQAVELLTELFDKTGKTGVVFPAILKRGSRFMSDSAFRKALGVKLDYAGEHTTHGFRGSAATILDECDFPSSWVNLAIAHWSKAKGDKSDAAYNSAEKLPQRRVMMQGYADYLDALVQGDAGALDALKAVRQ